MSISKIIAVGHPLVFLINESGGAEGNGRGKWDILYYTLFWCSNPTVTLTQIHFWC